MLTEKQLNDIKKLQHECEADEQFQLKLNWEMLQNRSSNENLDFFHYINNELVGFLGLYGFGTKIEVCGMVKPEYRRQGIFTKLFHDALDVISEGDYKTILLNSPANSVSGREFVMNQSCIYAMTEHQMQYDEKQSGDFKMTDKGLVLRNAGPEDFAEEVRLDISCFGFEEEEAKLYNERIKKDKDQEFYIIDLDGIVIGKIRVAHHNDEAWIFGYCIAPEHQGKGYGKQILLKVIKQEREKGYPLFLEVETKNDHALKLYETCGFRSYQSQDYYTLAR
ncbi:GNAT family N-acetyltransferase [Virgibacillus dakarensis]|uniref:GNAT family N-acetyltransferase n=1 Tax=Virgibacillus dakarensis TaxID=1917889 RepID=UPI000B4368CF|nr:GNAT family N-acetyltransferase [Virgibacillus dakarensis]MBT2217327.1 GNAT family N-acetyltransferase [Virgibacillus dakarensis]MTW86739.1 GNAT family N-acetyltransferase [Virgibacillus dakarensis]